MPGSTFGLPSTLSMNLSVERVETVLRLLARTAPRAGCDPWRYAVAVAELRGAGVAEAELRDLLWHGIIAHGEETTRAEAKQRSFRELHDRVLRDGSWLVLTPKGASLLGRPAWDEQHRTLWFFAAQVKRFRGEVENQETIVIAFDEDGWPPQIDDPLPVVDAVPPEQRLHDAIKGLNRRQVNELLRFRGDGTGRGVRWEPK